MMPITLMTLLVSLQVDTPTTKKNMGRLPVAWWDQAELCQQLGIREDQRVEFAEKLNHLQMSYQIAQTKLNDARQRQSNDMFDPTIDAQTIETLHRQDISTASAEILSLNFQARLFVRNALNANQLQKLQIEAPRFFSAKWFKRPRNKTYKGKVIEKK